MASFVLPVSKNIWDFDPTTIGGCCLWLDGADSNTLFSDTGGTTAATVGGSVAFWKDKSVLANNATQTTVGSRPTRASGGGINCVATGQTTGMFLNLDTPANLPSGTANATYFTVTTFNYNSAVGAGPRAIFAHGTNVDSQTRLIADRQTTQCFFACTGGNSIGGANTTANPVSTQTPHILSSTLNNLVASIFYNGTPGNNTNLDQQTPSIPLNTINSIAYVGNSILGGSGFGTYDGNISEILVFNVALSNADRQTIEGYLAWKWGLQSALPTSHPFNNNAITPQFTPNNFGASLWYDASDSTSVIQNAVYQWSDKSGNNNHLTQSNLSLCPLYTASNGITFNGFSTQLLFTTPNFIAGVNFTFFVVERRSISKTSNFFLSGNQALTNGNLHVGYGGYMGVDVPFVGYYGNDYGGVSIGAYTTPLTRIYKFNLTTTARTIYLNGSQSGSNNTTLTKLVSFSGGALGGGGQGYYQGDIFEVICYTNPTADATSFANDKIIEGYLAWKWATQENLPAGHPYKSAAPVSFVPTSLSGCALWLDSSDVSTVLRGLYWQNKALTTVSGRNSTGFPTYGTNIVNGKNAVLVSDTTQGTQLNVFNNSSFSYTNGQVSFFAVPYSLSTGANITDINTFSRFAVGWSTTGISASLLGANSSAANYSGLVGNPFIVELTSAGFSSTGTIYVNGNVVTTFTTGNATFTSFMPVLSRDGTPGPTYFCEIIAVNTLVTTTQRQQIEGYLAWKWGLQAFLPTGHPYALANYFYTNTRPFSRNFAPTDISDCIMWFDGADLTSMFTDTAGTTAVTGNGSIVRYWRDKSGSGNNITTAGTGPTLTTSSNPCGFDMNHATGHLSKIDVVNTSRTYTKFLVFRRTNDPANPANQFQRLFSYAKTFGDQRLTDPSGFHMQAGGSQTGLIVLKLTLGGSFTISTNTYYVVTIVANPLTMSLFLNGSLTPTTSITLPNTDFSGTTFRLGNSFTAGQLWPGFINETISYNRQLSVTEYREVEGYLAWKWGIRNSLPTGHPFYRFPTPSLTPIQPELQLYKNTFDPSDLAPDIWFDPQDKSTIAVDSNNRVMQWLNKGTSATCSSFLFPGYSSRTLNTTETLSNAIGLSGPLITTSTTGDGIGMDYLDFSGGGSFYISSVNISGTTAVITLGTAEVGTVTGGSISAFSISTGSGINTTTLATIYFSLQNMIHPFAIGSTIRVAGTVSTGTTLNGDWTVSACTPFYVQFALVGATAGTITTQGTITSVTTPNIATVTYTTSSRTQKLLAGHTLATISGMTPAGLNGTTPTIWNASPNSIQFLTSVATGTISAAGTITGPTVPHNIPAGAQVSIGLASGYRFSNNSDDSLYPIFNIESINLTTIVTGRGTPYIVASATTNTITVNIPNTTSYPSGFPAGNMQFSAGRVDYGSITIAGFNSQNVANTLTSTGNSSTSATINFTNFSRLRNNTFVAGDTIFINGVTNPTTYNGFWYVTGGTNTGLPGSVTIDTTAVGTLANMVSIAGTISRVSYSMPSGCLGIQSISVSGTTATVTYNNSTRQINGSQTGNPFKVGHYIYIARTTASGVTPGIFNGTWVVTGQSTDNITTGTLTFTISGAAGITAGTGILTRGSGGVGLTGAFPTTSGTIAATTATVTFANQPIVPFIAGQQIYIAGTTSSSTDINGTWTVLSSTNSSVTFTITGTAGNLTVQGTLSAAVLVVTSGTYASPNLTLNFSPTLAVAPFAANAMVSLFGVTPSANIGNWRVVSSTTSSVILNVPTGSGPIAAPFTGTVAFALPLTRGTGIPHGLSSGYNIQEGGGSLHAYFTNGENSNGLNNVIYTINAVPSVCTYQIFPLHSINTTALASMIQATVGPSIRTDIFPAQLFYPMSAYCLENTRSQTSGGIFNGSNASMIIIPHAYTPSLRLSQSGFSSPPALSTASSVNAGSDGKGNIMFGYFHFNSAPRVNALRQNQNMTANAGIDYYYQNQISLPGDDSSFRMYTRSLNLTSSTVNDVTPQTDIVGMVGGRYEAGLLNARENGYNLVSTVNAVVTNAVWSANVATLTILTPGNVPIPTGDTIVVAGVRNLGATQSVFNGSFVVSGTPSITSVSYPLATNPGGTYVPGTGTVVVTTSTPLTTGHIRLGARPNVLPSFTPVSPDFTNWLDVGISEIIAFNRILTTEERQLLEGYMAQKYGFQNNLGGRSTTTQFGQTARITNLFSVGTAPPYTISMSMAVSTNPFFPRRQVVVTGCTESPMVNGTWGIVSGANALTTFVSQNAVTNPVLVGVPNRLVGGTGTVTLTGNSTTVAMSAAQNVTSGTVVNGAVYTVTVPSQTVTVTSTTLLTLATAPIFSDGTSISGITLPVNSVLVTGCTLTSGSNAVSCNTTTATTGACPSTTNIMVLPTTTTTTTGTGVSSYVIVAPVTVISPILPSNTGATPVLSGVPNPIVGGTGTVTLTGNTSSITGISSQSITLGTVVTGSVYSVTFNGGTASAITTTSLTLSSAPVFSGGTTLSGVSMFVGSTLVTNCVLTSGSTSLTFPTTTIAGGTVIGQVTYIIVLPTTTTTTATGTVTSVNIATSTTHLSPIPVSSANTITGPRTLNTFIHPYRTTVPTIGSTLSLSTLYTQGLAAWFDAANSGTIGFSSGNFVNSWASAGGNISGLTLIQATVANQPTLVSNALNGLPGLRFVRGTISGSTYPNSSNLTSSLQTYTFNQFTTYATNNEMTWFTVLNFITSPATSGGVAIVANNGNQYILIQNSNIAQQIQQLAGPQATQVTGYSPSLLVSTPYIIVSTRRGNVLRNIVIGNGARNIASNTFANLSSQNYTVTGYRFTLGGYSATPASNGNPYGGDIYEHIMFRYALTDSQIFQIEGYLAWKWGLQTALPTTHPYYRLRP